MAAKDGVSGSGHAKAWVFQQQRSRLSHARSDLSGGKLLCAAAVAFAALLPSAWLVHQASDQPHLGRFHDDGLYWTAGKSLAEGNGYKIISLPGQPYQTKYPPLYPLVLSAVWRMNPHLPSNLVLASWINWLFVPLFVLAAYVATGQLGLAQRTQWAATLLVALHPAVALLGIHLMADLPFAALVLFSLTLAHAAQRDRSTSKALAAGAVASAAYLTKTAALPLLVIPAYLAVRRQFRASAVALLPMIAVGVSWHVWTHSHTSEVFQYYTGYIGYYLDDLRMGDLPRIIGRNSAHLVRAAGSLAVFDLYGGWQRFVCVLVGLFAIAAIARMVRRQSATVYVVFSAAYSALLACWNFPPTERFLLPLLPLVIAGLLSTWKSTRAAVAVVIVTGTFALAISIDAFVTQFPAFIRDQRQLCADRERAFSWADAHIPKDARLVAQFDTMLHLTTGRRASIVDIPQIAYYRDTAAALPAFVRLVREARDQQLYLSETSGDLWRQNGAPEDRDATLAYIAHRRGSGRSTGIPQ